MTSASRRPAFPFTAHTLKTLAINIAVEDCTDPDMDSPLIELAVELKELIGSFCDTPSLLNLRAACNDFEGATRSLQTKRCFQSGTFSLGDRTSMSYLLAISEHPVFSLTMRSATLAIGELNDADFTNTILHCHQGKDLQHGPRVGGLLLERR